MSTLCCGQIAPCLLLSPHNPSSLSEVPTPVTSPAKPSAHHLAPIQVPPGLLGPVSRHVVREAFSDPFQQERVLSPLSPNGTLFLSFTYYLLLSTLKYSCL